MNSIKLSEIPLEETEFSVLDFETTGTSAVNSRVIEIGLVKVKQLEIQETYQSFINPEVTIPHFITNLTGISNDDVINAPRFTDIVDDIKMFIDNSVITAHNINFDFSFLKSELLKAGEEIFNNHRVCTLKLSRKIYKGLPSKSLGAMTEHFKIKHKNVHRALGDATVTAKILIKIIRELQETYDIFTLGDLLSFQSLPQASKNYTFIPKKLADDFNNLPNKPGVYIFKDKDDEIIYVGKAKQLNQRVRNYFLKSPSPKVKKIVRAAKQLAYFDTASELSALLTEARLIKHHLPEFNSQLKRDGHAHFIKIDTSKKFPLLKTTAKFDFDGCDYFGPYTNRDNVRLLLDIINKSFLLRECTEKEFSKKKKCYLADIERCLAPCENQDLETEYNVELRKVKDFLTGNKQSTVDRLLLKMKEYADKHKYEEAAKIRDAVNLILNQIHRISVIAEPINKSNLLVEIANSSNPDKVLLIEGKVFLSTWENKLDETFEKALDNFYEGTIRLLPNIENKDLEQVKILLAWLAKNREAVRIHYLKDFSSKQELLNQIS